MQLPSDPVLGPRGNFNVTFHDHEKYVTTSHARDYGEALRSAKDGLLGSLGDAARIYLGNDLVNMAHLERVQVRGRGGKYIVRFALGGEKPRKRRR